MAIIDLRGEPVPALQQTLDVNIVEFICNLETAITIISGDCKRDPAKYRRLRFLKGDGTSEDLRTLLARVQDCIHDIRAHTRRHWFS